MGNSLNAGAQVPIWSFGNASLDPVTQVTGSYTNFNGFLYNPPTEDYYGYGKGAVVRLPSYDHLLVFTGPGPQPNAL